jgi:hypothetical protein
MLIMPIKLDQLHLTANNVRRASIRWRLANSMLRTIVITIGTGVIVLGSFGVLNAIEVINATAASVLVAVVFGVITIFQQRQSQRRQYTVDLLTVFFSGERISSATAWLAHREVTKKLSLERYL